MHKKSLYWLLLLIGLCSRIHAEGDSLCHVFLVQVPDKTPDDLLSDKEYPLALAIAQSLSSEPIAAIYTSDEPCAKQTAEIIASYHNLQVQEHVTLQAIAPNTLFQRMGGLRTFGVNLAEKHRGEQIVIVSHESLVRFVGRYVHGGYRNIPHFSYIKISSDGKSMFLSVLKNLFFSPQE
ncbi:MAG: histidine phosphatase family protein [Chlamydiae bacterium]|nr:histidine phosphatase family protein [Chlamydiota bacterium]